MSFILGILYGIVSVWVYMRWDDVNPEEILSLNGLAFLILFGWWILPLIIIVSGIKLIAAWFSKNWNK